MDIVNSWFVTLLLLLGVIVVGIVSFYRYLALHYDFWERQGVPHKEPVFPYGSLRDLALGRVRIGEAYDQLYREFQHERYFGVLELNYPVIAIRDPDLIKRVLIKDFSHFVDRDAFEFNPKEFINNHLSSMRGETWKKMRQQLAPAFSSRKIQTMYHLMLKVSDQLSESLSQLCEESEVVDVKDLLAKFTMDIIVSCAFGIEINSLSGGDDDKFYRSFKSIFKGSLKKTIIKKTFVLFPALARALNLQRIPKEAQRMMLSVISRTVKYREENHFDRGDFLDILIKLRQNKSITDGVEQDNVQQKNVSKDDVQSTSMEGLTLKDMTAQAFLFFAAGYETASSAMSCVLYELARHPGVQQRLCQEVDEALQRTGGRLCHQALKDMSYMDQVINETFRLYPTAGVIHRRCTQDYLVPHSDLVLRKGQKVCIPVNAIHHDPKYYPDPYKFDPDRFTPENIKTRQHCLHLPFGEGPRSCIGIRFGLMQTKTGLATILSKFRVAVAPETPECLEFEKSSIISVPKKVHLKIILRCS